MSCLEYVAVQVYCVSHLHGPRLVQFKDHVCLQEHVCSKEHVSAPKQRLQNKCWLNNRTGHAHDLFRTIERTNNTVDPSPWAPISQFKDVLKGSVPNASTKPNDVSAICQALCMRCLEYCIAQISHLSNLGGPMCFQLKYVLCVRTALM